MPIFGIKVSFMQLPGSADGEVRPVSEESQRRVGQRTKFEPAKAAVTKIETPRHIHVLFFHTLTSFFNRSYSYFRTGAFPPNPGIMAFGGGLRKVLSTQQYGTVAHFWVVINVSEKDNAGVAQCQGGNR